MTVFHFRVQFLCLFLVHEGYCNRGPEDLFVTPLSRNLSRVRNTSPCQPETCPVSIRYGDTCRVEGTEIDPVFIDKIIQQHP